MENKNIKLKYKNINLNVEEFNNLMEFMVMSNTYMRNIQKTYHPDQWDESGLQYPWERWEILRKKLVESEWVEESSQ